ncbi:sensor histidine kinase [Streptomyces griseiscabiei]|uniref:histidine kinase n=2 Tax=Streptomyces griseiscabiei TaxID=2993540 RepID=A0ABU4L7F3_9ACTN|nr:histidine kinase [Streptomyces griseiscabiei]MDX2911265.1 histidine kinase [Streptomyces griseiscabiei]
MEPGSLLGGPEHRTVVRLLAWLVSIQRASQEHPRVRQWAAPLVCAALGVPGLLDSAVGSDPGFLVALMVMIGFTVPLLARERRPFLVFAVITAFSVAEAVSGVLTYAHFLAQLIILYNLARFAPPVQLVVAVAITVPQTIVTIMTFAPDKQIERIDSPLAVTTDLVLCILAIAGLGLAGRVARAYIAALEDQTARLEVERDQRARLAEAMERARISREMHDILGHTLAVVVGLADGAAGLAETKPKQTADTLRIIADSGRGALADLRRLLTGIREEGPHEAPFRPQPGVGDLGALLERIRAAGPDVGLHTAGDLTGLPAGLQLALYRIVQEALTNTLKHAVYDTTVRVSLIAEKDAVHVTVEDSGPPAVERHQSREGGGQGLLGMRERAALYQGMVTAGPNSEGGWSVRAVLLRTPLANMASDAHPA